MWKSKLRIEDFELGRSLGTGAVGEIYSAKQLSTGKTVALKILQTGVSQDRMIRSRFEREIGILEKLRHPNIIEVYGGGDMNGQLFYAMEYVDAGSVKELLVQYGTLPWKEVATIARQVCSALQYAHNHGIIHRDLKPANLFLTKDGNVKLGDFGIARDTRSSDLTDHGLTVGTHAYMSPEQITADARISGKADLYALGCVLFEMLSGHPPFQGVNFAQLFEQHLRQPAPHIRDFVPDVPKGMDEIIDQCLRKSPEERPFNARQVQGVMISLVEVVSPLPNPTEVAQFDSTVPLADKTKSPPNTCSLDVGADHTVDSGQEQLSKRLRAGEHVTEVTWKAMLVLIGLGSIIVLLAILVLNWNRA